MDYKIDTAPELKSNEQQESSLTFKFMTTTNIRFPAVFTFRSVEKCSGLSSHFELFPKNVLILAPRTKIPDILMTVLIAVTPRVIHLIELGNYARSKEATKRNKLYNVFFCRAFHRAPDFIITFQCDPEVENDLMKN